MSGLSRLVIHIGLEKTGSTSFQKFCSDHRADLKRRGVLYPADPLSANALNHAPLVASYFSADEARALLIAGRRADRREAVAAVNAEIDAARPKLTLLSAEHFSSRFSPERIAQLGADFAGYECTVAVVVRDHLARARSAYATTIASGRSLTLDAFVEELCRPDNPYLRYRDTIGPWEERFARVRVFGYREGEDIVAELQEALLPGDLMGDTRYWLNASGSAAALERARRRNAAGGLIGRFARGFGALRGRGPAPRESLLAFDEGQRRRLDEVAAPDRDWLLQRYGLRLG